MSNKTKFSDIFFGSFFQCNGRTLIKLEETLYTSNEYDSAEVNAIDLKYGESYYFLPYDLVDTVEKVFS